MNYEEKKVMIERLSKEIKEEYLEKIEESDFSSFSNGYSEFPELLSEIDATLENLKLKIRVLRKAYEVIGRHPLCQINSDFESLDNMFNGVYEEILKLIGNGIEIEKKYHTNM